jgi:hypothetical protein
VPEAERLSHNELVSVADLYFSGIELNDGQGDYPFWDTCTHLENGFVTASDPAMIYGDNFSQDGSEPSLRMGCQEQFETGLFHDVTRIRDRHFVVIDPERGLAFAFIFFDNASGDDRFRTLTDGREVVSGPDLP